MYKNFLLKLFELPRNIKTLVQVLTDILLILFCFFLSIIIRLNDFSVITNINNWYVLTLLIPMTIFIYFQFGFYQSIIRFISEKLFFIAGFAIFLSSSIIFICTQFAEIYMPRSVPIIYFNFMFVLTISIRFIFKYVFINYKFNGRKPIAIYGAGEAGRNLFNSLIENSEYKPVLFLDDNNKLFGNKISNLKIFSFEKALTFIKKTNINLVLLAMPNISHSKKISIIDKLHKESLEVKTIPNMRDIIHGKAAITDISNLKIKDILERAEIPSKSSLMKKNVFNRIVLVTGGGGSIGSELCNQIIKIKPKVLIYLDNSEYALYKIDQDIKQTIMENNLKMEVYPILGSIQDKHFLYSVFNKFRIETIFHAAAYKHVPLVEKNIIAGIKNNVFGTKILADLAIKKNIKSFILISSDKAVRPTNYMGVTKRLAELICQSLYEKQNNTTFSIVRFGNVIGSSGSVIPLFEKQIKNGGPVTLTDKNVTRFFMTIKEAVGLVIQAGAMSKNGDVFILNMGKPIRILDLAKKMIRLYGKKPVVFDNDTNFVNPDNSIIIKIIGLRTGEKIFEELLLGNSTSTTKHPRILKAREKSIEKHSLISLLKKLENYCKEQDLTKIKFALENAPVDFDTTNNFSELE